MTFDCGAAPPPPGAVAAPRPSHRPRHVEAAAENGATLQAFDCRDIEPSPGTSPARRPSGRERRLPSDASSATEGGEIARQFVDRVVAACAPTEPCGRELAVGLLRGMTAREMADRLHCSVRAVRTKYRMMRAAIRQLLSSAEEQADNPKAGRSMTQ